MKEIKMADTTTTTTMSRRSTRLFMEERDALEAVTAWQMECESRQNFEEKEQEKAQKTQKSPKKTSPIRIEPPMADFGKDLCGIYPSIEEDSDDYLAKSLYANNGEKTRGEGQPVNFGIVLPGAVYRSSFPITEDFHFLGTLGLTTVLSLVKKDFAPEFKAFMKAQGIRHIVVDMQGTKKADIPEDIMHSIMEVALNESNYPLLIHCNHGKHRTGCAVAVIRHVAGWAVDSIVREYQGFAEPKVRECDVKYITEYEVNRLEGLFAEKRRSPALATWKMAKYTIGSALALSLWISTALFLEQHQ